MFNSLFYNKLTYMTIRILLFLILSISISFPQNGNERLNKFLKDWVSYFGAPSISAGISNNGKIVWINSSGLSNLEQSVTATPQTPYRVASVSKAITGVAIMQLVEKGKLKLDEDIRKYLPQFPKKSWTFTIRQILNHTSGFRNYKNSAEFDSKVNFETTDD
ncbi:MAG: beta-lactamase family protein, partial [Ignavibacteriaceae bacterium]|nr:beta-lactamase family protein [Ignavibacteriaceae bacterium]